MPKNVSKNFKKQPFTKRVFIVSCFVALILMAIGIAVKHWYVNPYIQAANRAELTPVRELILKASSQLKVDAVRDPKTGDNYFPEAKLYIPGIGFSSGLTYDVTLNSDVAEISISNKSAFGQAATGLYNASDMRTMFEAVPKLQACQRGIKLVYRPMGGAEMGDTELIQTVRLDNGKELYAYAENKCPELKGMADGLKHIQSY